MPRKKRKTVDVRPADKALGEDKVEEIVNKEWKTAELPPEEVLSSEKPKSPMARNNPNSRKNLIQYRKDKPKEVKEKVVKNLTYKKSRTTLDLKKFFGDALTKDMIEMLDPFLDVLESSKEEKLFFGTVKKFLVDLEKDGLTSTDLDDIVNLALNRVLELRLLVEAKSYPKRVMDIAATIERFRKNSEKIKASLGSRRSDRIDTKNKQTYSIVDVAAQIDSDKREEMEALREKLKKEQKEFLEKHGDRRLIE